MSRRKKTSGGQAIVMVTLALLAMGGMMGLAVDMGWSFFVEKEAQAAADGAALAAVQRGYYYATLNHASFATMNCTFVSCVAERDCTFTSGSNLASACLYAKTSGFSPTGSGQKVRIEANIPSIKPINGATSFAPGVTDLSYWVTVKVVQTVPQLFSAIQGHPLATISAISTSGILRQSVQSSLVGMNQAGDCTHAWNTTNNGANGTWATNSSGCGVDVSLSGPGGTCGGGTYHICTPNTVILASNCSGSSQAGCAASGGTGNSMAPGSNYAGTADVLASNTQVAGNGKVNPNSNWTPVTNGATAGQSGDPTTGMTQPPLAASSAPPSCGISGGATGGTISGTVTLGPYQYYSYTSLDPVSHKPIPNGLPVQITPPGSGASTVTFSSTGGTCPGVLSATGTAQTSNAFPMYVFYGGLNVTDSGNGYGTTGTTSVNFGAGQYVMAGTKQDTPAAITTNSVTGMNASTGMVFSAINATLTGDGTSTATNNTNQGTMFVLTDGNYSSGAAGATSLSSMMAATVPNYTTNLTTLKQGSSLITGGDINLAGLNKSSLTGQGSALTDYGGMLIWQDRRNSADNIDPATGKYLGSTPPSSNDVNSSQTSPGLVLATGGGFDELGSGDNKVHPAGMNLNGVIYQPRGAWLALGHAISEQDPGDLGDIRASWNLKLQIITGAVTLGPNIGIAPDDNGKQFLADDFWVILQLAQANNTLSRYRVALIR